MFRLLDSSVIPFAARSGLKRDLAISALLAAALTFSLHAPGASAAYFSAKASLTPTFQYLNDTAGTLFRLRIRNNGTLRSIGAVEIRRPDATWSIIGCPEAPAGWTTDQTAVRCRYRSAAGPTDDVDPGDVNNAFTFRATTAPGSQGRIGTWTVIVSRTNGFADPSKLKEALPGGSGLRTSVFGWQVLSAVVRSGPAMPGTACPAADQSAPAGSSGHTLVICGRNRMTVSSTPKAARSVLDGSFVASNGGFTSAPVAPSMNSRVLGNWSDVTITSTSGTDHSVIAKIASSRVRKSPLTPLTGFEALNTGPVVTTSAGSTPYTEGAPATAIDGGLIVSDADDTTLEGGQVRLSANFQAGDDLVFVNTASISGVYNTGTGVLALSGTDTVANYQAALRSIDFRTTTDNPSASKTVEFKVNDGDNDSNLATKAIAITPVNDAPVLDTTDAALSYNEGDGAVAVDGAITAADPDSTNLQGATVQITANFSSADDELAFTNQLGITGAYNDTTGTLTLSGTTTVANYQTALRSVTYTNSSENPSGARTVSFQVTDSSGAASTTATRDINLSAANDAPVVTTSAGSTPYTEGAPATAIDGGLIVSDADDTTLEGGQVRLSANFQAGDDLVFVNTASISGVYNTGTGVLALSGTDTVANYQAALRSIDFRTTTDNPSASKTVEFKVNDGDNDSNLATKAIAITPVNDAPVLDTTDAALSYNEGDGAVAVDGAITAADPDSTNLQGATVQITANFSSADDELAFTNQLGITGAYNDTTGTLTLSGTTTVANYQTALRSVTYTNSSENPSGARTVSFQVTDSSGAASTTATRDINLSAANDAPVVTTSAGSTPYTEGAPATAIDGGLIVSDADDTTLEGGQVRLSANFQAGDDLVFVNTASISGVYNTGTGVLALSGTDTVANYQAALRSIDFRTTTDNPSASKTVEFKVNDGDNDSNLATKAIAITPVNDAPTVTTSVGSADFFEGGGPVAVDPGITVADPDSANLQGATATISVNYSAADGDTLGFSDQLGITGSFNPGTGVLTLSGTSTVANYQTALRSITFSNTDTSPGLNTATRTVSFQVSDASAAASNSATRGVSVSPPNATPVADSQAGVPTDEDTEKIITLIASDADDDALTFTAVDPANGSLDTLTPIADCTAVNTCSAQVTYTADDNYNGPDSFTFTVNDTHVDSADGTVSISVDPVNDAPEATNLSAAETYVEETALNLVNIVTSDVDNSNLTVTLTLSSPAAGSLSTGTSGGVTSTFNAGTGVWSASGAIVDVNTLLAGVTFDPSTNFDANFTIATSVSDGIAAPVTGSKAMTATAVNDPPQATNLSAAETYTEDTALNLIDIVTSDVDDGSLTVTLTLSSPASGSLSTATSGAVTSTYNAGTGVWTAAGAIANVNILLAGVTFAPTLNFNANFSIATSVSDGVAVALTGTKAMTGTPVDDAPTALNITPPSFAEDTASTITLSYVDPEGDLATSATISSPVNVTVTTAASCSAGVCTVGVTGTLNHAGAASFGYTVTANGLQSNVATASLTITAVNDAPVNTAPASATVDEDTTLGFSGGSAVSIADVDSAAGLLQVSLSVTNGTLTMTTLTGLSFSSGDGTADAAMIFTGTLTNINAAFATLSFRPTLNFPGAAASGTAVFSMTTNDQGNTGSGGALSDTDGFNITVNQVNDAPVADDETFNGASSAVGNTSLVVDDPADGPPSATGAKKSITGDILDGDTDVDGPGPLTVTAGTFATSDGGSVTIEADGDFVYLPNDGGSCTDTSDSFSYTLEDSGSPELTGTGTVNISIAGCVWYVDNATAPGGDGRSSLPFDTLEEADVAAVTTGATIYVHRGNGSTTGLSTTVDLLANQRLHGEAIHLVVDGTTLFTGAGGQRPNLAGNILLAAGNHLSGFAIAGSASPAIAGGAGDASGTIADVVATGSAGGLQLSGTSGTWNLSDLTVSTTGGEAVAISSAGTVNFTSTGTISVTSAAGAGARITGTTTSGVIDSVTVSSSSNEGIVLDDNPGALTVNDINLTTSGTGLLVDSSNDVTINGGDADITAAGAAVSLTTVTSNPANMPDVTLDAVTSTGGTVGIVVDDIGAGTFSAASGTLSGHSLAEIDINLGDGDISYGGTIGNGSGLSAEVSNRTGGAVTISGNINDTNDGGASGGGISVSGNTGGSSTFSGGTKTLNTGALTAVALANNPGHSIAFTSGGLDIDTTTAAGFSATAGGTVTVGTGAGDNTIDTGSGTAATITSTTIGAGNVTFRSVSSNGGTNGIVLASTGTGAGNGSFIVTGNSAGTCGTAGTIADCSGGTITGKSGDAISLSSTLSPSFTRVNLANNNGSGVAATGVSGLTVAHSRIDDSGDTAGISEAGISLTNVTGTTSVSSSTVSHSFDSNVHWNISSGTGTVTVASSNIGPTNIDGTLGNSGIQVIGTSTGVGTLNVTGSTFDDNNAMGVGTSMANSSALTLNVSTSTFTDNNMAVAVGVVDDADITFDINGNTALRSETNGFQVLSGETSNTGSHVTGFIRNNTIGNANADSGSRDLHGIAVELNDDADGIISILSNTIQHVDQHGIFVTTRDLTGTDPTPLDTTLDIHIRDNAILSIDDNSIVPIGLVYGMLIDARSASNMCLDINSNDSFNIAAQDIRVRQRDTSVFRLERFVGNGALVTDVESFIVAQNDPGTTADATLATGFTGVADGTCRDP